MCVAVAAAGGVDPHWAEGGRHLVDDLAQPTVQIGRRSPPQRTAPPVGAASLLPRLASWMPGASLVVGSAAANDAEVLISLSS